MNRLPAQTPLTNDQVEELLHDLRGPLVTIKGFSLEVQDAVERLRSVISESATSLSKDAQVELALLLDEDIFPCLRFLGSAAEQMDDRMNRFAGLRVANDSR